MLKVENLSKHILIGKQRVSLIDDLSFSLEKGQVLGLIGESGCGKTTLAKMILRLISISSGKIYLEGEEITHKKTKYTARKMQMVFQDPFSSLNPLFTVEKSLLEPTEIHGLPSRVEELLDLVKLPQLFKARYPQELSGGERQKVAIARAIALKPHLLICDEPVASLDFQSQTEIFDLFLELKNSLSLTILLISHDQMAVVSFADDVMVMKQGKIYSVPYKEGHDNEIPQRIFPSESLLAFQT